MPLRGEEETLKENNRFAGADIGFGDFKGIISGTEQMNIKFPTAVAYVRKSITDIGEASETYTYQGRDYLVGQEAIFNAFSTRSLEFLLKYAPLLLYKAFKDFKEVSHIAVGLPVGFYTAENRKALSEALRSFEVNGDKKQFHVEVFPQGVGILIDYRYDHSGQEIKDTDTDGVIVDLGHFTIDVVPFERGVAVRDGSGMLEGEGISKACDELAAHIQAETKVRLNEQETKEVFLNGKLPIYGKERDFSTVIRNIVEGYIEEVLHAISSRWERRIQRANKMILAGGGAYYLEQYIPERYKDLICIPDDPEFANARGFLKGLKLKYVDTKAQEKLSE
jgi:hypothetical protein